MNVSDDTSAMPLKAGSPKKAAINPLPPAKTAVNTMPIATLSQNSVLTSTSEIRVFCVEASEEPRSISIGASPTSARTMATRPKSSGLSSRANRIVDATCTMILTPRATTKVTPLCRDVRPRPAYGLFSSKYLSTSRFKGRCSFSSRPSRSVLVAPAFRRSFQPDLTPIGIDGARTEAPANCITRFTNDTLQDDGIGLEADHLAGPLVDDVRHSTTDFVFALGKRNHFRIEI